MTAPYVQDADMTLYVGDALEVLRGLPDESVHCVVTSPPYWGLRDYGTGEWEGGAPDCDHVQRMARGDAGRVSTDDRGGGINPAPVETPLRFRDVCGKCGATRTDRQLGLEPTPEEYVQAMVNVFREVRRVLRRDGTCWLNLGDTYNAYNGNRGLSGSTLEGTDRPEARPRLPSGHGLSAGGLKPKDLVGIPWSVAKALQAPYYTGRIKDERDRIWLAAMVDAEGCIHIHRRKAGTASGSKFTRKDGTEVNYARTQDTYGVMVSIDNTSEAIIDRAHAIIGQGSRYVHEAGAGKQKRKQTLYRLTLTGQQSREFLRELYPHLVAKQHEARIAYNAPSSGDQAAIYHEAIKALHNGRDTTIDAPAPPTLFEPGWYLRSDICWAKSNPMPESVTDRPTKAHEYVFLLTREPRYFFDQEAVREPHESTRWGGPVAKDTADWKYRNGGDLVGTRERDGREFYPNGGRNVRSVWEIATQPYPDAHFATFPEALPERCIKAGTSERGCCPACGAPWEREVARGAVTSTGGSKTGARASNLATVSPAGQTAENAYNTGAFVAREKITTGWRATCNHKTAAPIPATASTLSEGAGVGNEPGVGAAEVVPCTVLDPFLGSGTTALVARRLGRRSIGIELNERYAALAAERTKQLSLLAGDGAA